MWWSARAGVSGGTWLDIWLPGFVAGGMTATTRVAPIAHTGELLGLIACERPADGAAFTEDDDRLLTDLARQVGLALHNVQLDTALQASLDELRSTNEELRAPRGCASSRPATPSDESSNATCTTARNSTWWRWP